MEAERILPLLESTCNRMLTITQLFGGSPTGTCIQLTADLTCGLAGGKCRTTMVAV